MTARKACGESLRFLHVEGRLGGWWWLSQGAESIALKRGRASHIFVDETLRQGVSELLPIGNNFSTIDVS